MPWGFRLKGGAEYNVPLSILKVTPPGPASHIPPQLTPTPYRQVNPGSPADGKLECHDVVQSIGNYSALYLKHEEALNIIRLFEYHLPLVCKRESNAPLANPNSSLFWSPSQAPANKPVFVIEKPNSNFSGSFQHNLSAGPAWPQYHDHQPHQPPQQQQQPAEPEHDYRMDSDYKSQYNYQPIYQQSFPIGLQQVPYPYEKLLTKTNNLASNSYPPRPRPQPEQQFKTERPGSALSDLTSYSLPRTASSSFSSKNNLRRSSSGAYMPPGVANLARGFENYDMSSTV